jgi:hypothetical protein
MGFGGLFADGGDDLLGGIGQVICRDNRKTAFAEHFLALFYFGSF